jgi:hypothetical protein
MYEKSDSSHDGTAVPTGWEDVKSPDDLEQEKQENVV